MQYFLQFVTVSIMIMGLFCALRPRYYGLSLIVSAGMFYWFLIGRPPLSRGVVYAILVLFIIGEFGTRILRVRWTQKHNISRLYSVNTTVGNIAGIIAADVLLGPYAGIIAWELIVGKSWLPRLDIVGQIIYKLAAISIVRMFCGTLIFMLVILYFFK